MYAKIMIYKFYPLITLQYHFCLTGLKFFKPSDSFDDFYNKFISNMNSYDYIIAGAGASGLTLATLLVQKLDDQKSILIIDKDDKSTNDRTWSFWEAGNNLFEEIVYQSWPRAIVKGRSFEALYEIAPYRYKTIRGKDFYDTLVPKLQSSPQVTWIKSEITKIEPHGEVHTHNGQFKAKIVFNSTINYQALNFEGANNILQHFQGWIIKTDKHHFDPDTVTYMDFTPDQEGDCRFGYILPFAENEALIEYTLFNKSLLSDEQYDQKLKDYIKSLGIGQYEIVEVEKRCDSHDRLSFQDQGK
jgi:lycopene beta-cyclase